MVHLLPDRLPWFVVGPLIGLTVVWLYVLANRPLGASGMFEEVLTLARRPVDAVRWQVWLFLGIVAGAAFEAFLAGRPAAGLAYGALGDVVPLPWLIPLLFGGGLLVGYGARWAGGCTSGHGICGTAVGSPGSFVATGTFMVTAIGVTAVLHLISGGAL